MVPAFGGKVVSEIYIPNARPVMASVRPGILNTVEAAAKDAEIVTVDGAFVSDIRSGEEFLGFEENEHAAADIEAAEVVISAGRGAASDIAWKSVNELADRLGGAVAYSRSFIDTGRVPDESCMIGTSGKAVRLIAEADNGQWKADGQDLQHVRIHAVDSKGRRVYNAQHELHFAVEGDARIVAVTNGDIKSDELNCTDHRRLYNGSALVILRTGDAPCPITLKTASPAFKTVVTKISK
jgi:hypothetical protein